MIDPTLPWALIWVIVVGILLWRRENIGNLKVASWLIVIGAVLAGTEDGFLALWLPLAPPALDPASVAGMDPHARAHMVGAGIWALLAAGVAVVLALGPLRRKERWAWKVLLVMFVIGQGADLVLYSLFYTHGLDVPLPGASGGFGWPPILVGAATWGLGLVLAAREVRT